MISAQTFDAAAPTIPVRIGVVSAEEAIRLMPELIELLRNSVAEGASVGFLHPLSHSVARRYWLSVLPEIREGSRLLMVAVAPDRILGSVQLDLPSFPSALHRAKVEKLLVDSSTLKQGGAAILMHALHDLARQHGRTLLLLGTRKGDHLEGFARELGYVEAGVIPRYTWGANGEPGDYVQFYLNIERREGTRLGTQAVTDRMTGDGGFKY